MKSSFPMSSLPTFLIFFDESEFYEFKGKVIFSIIPGFPEKEITSCFCYKIQNSVYRTRR